MRRMRLRGSQKITFSAMIIALSVVCLYIASLLPGGSPALYFIASVLVAALVLEDEPMLAVLAFIAVSVLAMLVVPNKLMVMPYAALLGHYCVFKLAIERIVRGKVGRFALKLVYLNAFTALALWLCAEIFGFSPDFSEILPLWALIPIAEAILVVYDLLLTYTIRFYSANIRQLLVGRNRRN